MSPPQPGVAPVVISDADGVVAVAKPHGWNTHDVGTDAPDVGAWLADQGLGRVAPAHRLDLHTSGVLLFARSSAVAAALGAMFEAHTVAKTYVALVAGRTRDAAVLRRPLPDGRRGHALAAITAFTTLEHLGGFSLLSVEPQTGRKHQIRRHLAMVDHPIVGDVRYGPKRPVRVPAFPGRLWLHAQRLVLPDGRTFEAALPAELEAHLSVLRAGLSPSSSTPDVT